MRALAVVGVVVAALVARATPAGACSLAAGFIAPTNVELVGQAEAIVVAQADGYTPRPNDLGVFDFTVTQVLKGTGLRKGARLALEGSDAYGGRSPRDDFSRARRGAYAGGCVAYDYAVGKSFLLLLARSGSSWRPLGAPFARVNEEVDPAGEPWLTAVAAYVRVLALPAARQDAAFAKLAAQGGAIGDDVTAHLAAPTPGKPFAMLRRAYEREPGDRSKLVLAIGKRGDPAARTFMRGLVDALAAGTLERVDPRTAFDGIAAYYARVKDPRALAAVAKIYIALGAAQQETRWPLMWLLIVHADATHLRAMETALAGASDEEAGRLGGYFARVRSPAAIAELARRTDGHYAERWQLALALAGAGDPQVVAWARQRLATTPDDNRWIAGYVIARSPLAIADAVAATIIQQGGSDLVSLVQGYEEAAHPFAGRRLAEIARHAPTPEVREWLDRTVAGRAQPFDPSR